MQGFPTLDPNGSTRQRDDCRSTCARLDEGPGDDRNRIVTQASSSVIPTNAVCD